LVYCCRESSDDAQAAHEHGRPNSGAALAVSLKSATAACSDNQAPVGFEITHPFHPKRGSKYVLVTRQCNWGEDRMLFFDADGRLRSMLASWTSVAEQDEFAQGAAGRSWFRIDDLLRLRAVLDELGVPGRRGGGRVK